MSMRAAAGLSFALAAACAVSIDESPGRACDEVHPCRAGRFCVFGRCVDELPDVDGGNTGPSDAGDAGGPGGPDAGHFWSQAVHGFSDTQVFPGCFLEIDVLRNNRVVSGVKSANDLNDRATANVRSLAYFPTTGEGKLRGRFQIPAALRLGGNSTWLVLSGTNGVQIATLFFTPTGQIGSFSGADTLSPTASTVYGSVDGGIQPNRDYLVELAWRRGAFKNVSVDGSPVIRQTFSTPPSAQSPDPDFLRLGIFRYDGAADAGWTITLSDWQMADDAMAPLKN